MVTCGDSILNLVFLCNILKILVFQMHAHPREPNNFRRGLKAGIMLVPLFGLQLLLTIYRPDPSLTSDQLYELVTAAVINSQGIFVAVIFCFSNNEVLALVCCRRQARLASRRGGGSDSRQMSSSHLTQMTVSDDAMMQQQQQQHNHHDQRQQEGKCVSDDTHLAPKLVRQQTVVICDNQVETDDATEQKETAAVTCSALDPPDHDLSIRNHPRQINVVLSE